MRALKFAIMLSILSLRAADSPGMVRRTLKSALPVNNIARSQSATARGCRQICGQKICEPHIGAQEVLSWEGKK